LLKIRLAVFHMDHELRPDSAKDAVYVRRLAVRHGLECHVGSPQRATPSGGSIEMWARYERARAGGEIAQEIGATRYADGHTMDDQAETVLIGLVRGWGLEGMRGISRTNGIMVRPLLDVTRAEVEAFCRALHLRPRRDASNDDTDLLRNAIRHRVLPTIEAATGRNVTATFARTADLLSRDAEAMFAHATEIATEMVETGDRAFAIPARELVELPESLGSRVVRHAFQMVDGNWDRDAIEGVLDLARGRPGRSRDLVRGSTATRDRRYVRVRLGQTWEELGLRRA
jgi:tRNA(Ile)-lysidine synthase